MKDVAIFALTTGGLVQIQRITHERAPLSMMVVGRGSERLSISDRYDDFVYPGGGPVERFFGPFAKGGFRLEVSAPINSGDSWQLAAFMAHAVLADDTCQLCRDADGADTILCLTGLVDFDGLVGGVGHIPEKLHAAQAQLNEWQAAGRSAIIAVPSGPDHDRALAAEQPAGLSVMASANVMDLCRQLGVSLDPEEIAVSEPVQPQPPPQPQTQSGRRRPWELVLMAIILAVGGYIFLSQREPTEPAVEIVKETPPAAKPIVKTPVVATPVTPQPEPLAPAIKLPAPKVQVAVTPKTKSPVPKPAVPPTIRPMPPENPVSLAVLERHAPHGYQCEHVYFGKAQAVVRAVPFLDPQHLMPTRAKVSQGTALCGLLLRIELGATPLYAVAKVDMLQGRMVGTRHPPADLSGRRLVKGRRDWSIDLPFRGSGPVRYRLTLVTSTAPIRDGQSGDAGPHKTASLLHEVSR